MSGKDFGQLVNHKIRKAVFTMDRIASQTLRHNVNLSLSQFLVLLAISRLPEASQRQIAQFLELTPAAVSRQIKLLRAKNLIQWRTNAANRREHLLSVTREGTQKFKEARRLLNGTFASILRGMDDPEREVLHRSLDKLLGSLAHKEKTDLKKLPSNPEL